MNVLIYSGEGTSVESVRQSKGFLTRLLSPHYAVSIVTAQQILEEPWMAYTAMLVIPGGADIPYGKALNGAGNKIISQFVKKGGVFVGICAGGYYGSSKIEFEAGTPMEVSGPRELSFYSGVAKGTVFKGFKYGSDAGARAARIVTNQQGEEKTTVTYYNGGCLFEGDADAEVLARYVPPVEISAAEPSPAAVVLKTVGNGKVMLSGVHFEYDLDEKVVHDRDIPDDVVADIYAARQSRHAFAEYVFGEKLGLKINAQGEAATPQLTPLYLSSLQGLSPSVSSFMEGLKPVLTADGSLIDKEDHFKYIDAVEKRSHSGAAEEKRVFVYSNGCPTVHETPFFNHGLYYAELASFREQIDARNSPALGSLMLYGEVVSSTSTMLERNNELLKRTPHGLVAFGSQQIAGRGRGSNVWVNPVGVMAVSGVLRIPQSQCHQSLVFIQYISSLALVRAIHSFLDDKTDIGLRLKWPNDVYAQIDNSGSPSSYAKISGVLVSCTVVSGDYVVVFGSGTNIDNPNPTISVNSRLAQLGLGFQLSIERLLARFLTILDQMVRVFLVSGFGVFEEEYKRVWMHSDAEVTLERYGNVKARVKGISSDTGMLVAEDETGARYELQPDGNSFDMLRGLIRKKTY